MLGFAIADRQPDAEATAVWLTSREGARVKHTNAVVIRHDDAKYSSTVRNLASHRAVILTEGTDAPPDFIGWLHIADFETLIDQTAAHQTRIVQAIDDHRTRTRNRNLVVPEFAPAPTLRPAQHDEPAYRALSVADYIGNIWAAWLFTEEHRLRRTGDTVSRNAGAILPDDMRSPIMADFPPEFRALVAPAVAT